MTFDFSTFPIPEELSVNMDHITEQETEKAIKTLKNNKVARSDQISAESLETLETRRSQYSN